MHVDSNQRWCDVGWIEKFDFFKMMIIMEREHCFLFFFFPFLCLALICSSALGDYWFEHEIYQGGARYQH